MPDTTKRYLALCEACPHHRGVAGSTEGTEAVMPIRILFGRSVMGDSIDRYWSSLYALVVLHVTERGVIVALFLPPLIIIS